MARTPSVIRPECGTVTGHNWHIMMDEKSCKPCQAWRREYIKRFDQTRAFRKRMDMVKFREYDWSSSFERINRTLHGNDDIHPRIHEGLDVIWPAVFALADIRDTSYMYEDLLYAIEDEYEDLLADHSH